jgi:putative membrane protein
MVLMIKGVREILKSDFRAVKGNPVVMIVLFGIILVPSFYALLNIEASWNPYNETSNIKIAVVNEDLGYAANGTQYNVGTNLVDELKNNKDFNWQFVDEETALNGVKNGKYYAALIIPGNFSEQVLSIDTASPQQAKIKYIINDKLNPIAPRMTNVGMDTLQSKINDEIVETVDGIIFGKLGDAGNLAQQNKAQFLKTKALVNEMNRKIGDVDSTITEANSVMGTVKDVWSKISAALPQIQSDASYVENGYNTLYSYVGSDPQKAITTAQSMETSVSDMITYLKYVDAILTSLYDVTGDEQLKPIINQVEGDITQANNVLTLLNEVETDLTNDGTTGRLAELKNSIDGMNSAVNTLVANEGEINQAVNEASAKLGVVNSDWPTIKSAIQVAAYKLNSIDEGDLDRLIALSDMDPDDVGNYFESPVKLETEHMYRINDYGSAIAPFYIVLSLWIGGIVAVAMMKMQVASRKRYHGTTVYLGRMGIFLVIGVLQALVVALGSLFIKVQVSSALLFVLTIVYIGICFMIIIYSLTSLFGNVGKFFAVVFLVLQIAGAGGTFPVQVLPPFFQAVNPYLPFTYAISALHEIIAGVLWSNYWHCMIVLTVFPALVFFLALLIKEKLSKPAEWVEKKLEESGLF